MAYPQAENVLGSATFLESVSYDVPSDLLAKGPHVEEIGMAASLTEKMLIKKELPNELEAKRRALFGGDRRNYSGSSVQPTSTQDSTRPVDRQYSVRLSFSGFIFSLVDSSPSEICTIAVDNINAMAKWNQLRTSDASFLLSVGWLQVDNHIPSAPFPVAISPDGNESHESSKDVINPTESREGTPETNAPPLLFLGVEIAPKHSSGIVVSYRSSIIEPPSLLRSNVKICFMLWGR